MKSFILLTILFFTTKFTFGSVCWYTFEDDTLQYEKIFIGKVESISFFHVGFESAYINFIPITEIKGVFYKNKMITINALGYSNYPFLKDSIYIVFAKKECDNCFFTPYVSGLECSSTQLLSTDPNILEKFNSFNHVDTISENSLYQKITKKEKEYEINIKQEEEYLEGLVSKSKFYKLIAIIATSLLTITLIICGYLKMKKRIN